VKRRVNNELVAGLLIVSRQFETRDGMHFGVAVLEFIDNRRPHVEVGRSPVAVTCIASRSGSTAWAESREVVYDDHHLNLFSHNTWLKKSCQSFNERARLEIHGRVRTWRPPLVVVTADAE
jgi:hypothetical protein